MTLEKECPHFCFPLEMATHSSILAWKIAQTEETGELCGHRELDMTERARTYPKCHGTPSFPPFLLAVLSFLDRGDALPLGRLSHWPAFSPFGASS